MVCAGLCKIKEITCPSIFARNPPKWCRASFCEEYHKALRQNTGREALQNSSKRCPVQHTLSIQSLPDLTLRVALIKPFSFCMTAEPSLTLVHVQNLHKSHPAPSGIQPVEILRGLDFTLEDGGTTAILGPSGSGKSTFLNILGALDTFDSGSVQVGGLDIRQLKDRELARYRNQTVGFVFQMHHLLPQCTVLENVLVPSLASSRVDRRQIKPAPKNFWTRWDWRID